MSEQDIDPEDELPDDDSPDAADAGGFMPQVPTSDSPELWDDGTLPEIKIDNPQQNDPAVQEDPDQTLTLFNTVYTPVFLATTTGSSAAVYPMAWSETVMVGSTPTIMPGGRSGSGTGSGAFTLNGQGLSSGVTGFMLARMSNDLSKFDYVFSPMAPSGTATPRVVPTAQATPNHCYSGYVQNPPTVNFSNATPSSAVTTFNLGSSGAACFIVNASELNISATTYTGFSGWLLTSFSAPTSYIASLLQINSSGVGVYMINADPGAACVP